MALVERLMGLSDDGSVPPIPSLARKIPVHDFFAACNEIVAGAVTIADVKTAFNMSAIVDDSGTSDVADFDAFIAKAPSMNDLGAISLYIERAHSLFLLAESKYTGYSTPSAVRSKFSYTPPLNREVLKLNSDLSTSSTSLVSVPGMSFNIVSGNCYNFKFNVIFSSAASNNCIVLSVSIPSVTVFSAKACIPVAGDGTSAELQGWITSSDDTVTGTGVQTADINYLAIVEGTIIPSANGSLQLRGAARLGNSNITVRQGTFGVLNYVK